MPQLSFNLPQGRTDIRVDHLIIAGWTGRDRAAVEHHIAELAALGVKAPRSTPCFYRVGHDLLSQADTIDVVGHDSSGEAEFLLIASPDGLLVSVGSDHTDRKVEAYGVTVSKQVCPKPVAREAWRLDDVAPHWDELRLRSYVTREGERHLYQDGPVTGMLHPADLVARQAGGASLPAATAMFCGTLPVIGGIAGGERFEVELIDPVLDRTLRHAYGVRALTIAD